jgi:hypothetical protein
LIDESFARLTSIFADVLGVDTAFRLVVGEGLKREGKWKTEMFLEFIAIGPHLCGGFDV